MERRKILKDDSRVATGARWGERQNMYTVTNCYSQNVALG